MIEFNHYPAQGTAGEDIKITIASGPVIIEDGQVLLDKHGDNNFWKFPGGRLCDDNSPRDNARREAKEELGIAIELTSEPFVVVVERIETGVKNYVILIHYLAKRLTDQIIPGVDILQWAWHDVNNLPADCAENIRLAVEHFKK